MFAGLTALLTALFFTLIPEAGLGVEGGFQKESARLVMGHVSESHALWDLLRREAHRPLALLLLLAPFLVSMGAGAFIWGKGFRQKNRRLLILPLAFFVFVFMGLTLFWQRRFMPYVPLFAAPLVAWVCAWIEARFAGKQLRAFLVLLLFVPTIVVPFLITQRPLFPDWAFFYAAEPPKPCDPSAAVSFLGQASGLGSASRTIMNVVSDGPALLYGTPHRVLVAPYNVATNGEGFAFFSDTDGKMAKKIAQEENVDFVLVCRLVPMAYVPIGRSLSVKNHSELTLIEKLALRQPPKWLREVEGFRSSTYRLYETKL